MKKNTRTDADVKMGRPTLYKDEFVEQVKGLCWLGAIDKEIADFFGVTETTINNWKIKHPDFFESIKEGKLWADANMAGALYKSGMGEHYTEEDRVISDGDGGQEVVTLKKQIPPDYRAQSLWLRNRRPENWRDKVEVDTAIEIKETSVEFLEENFIKVMERSRERQRKLREDRGLDEYAQDQTD